MSLRLIQIILANDSVDLIGQLSGADKALGRWNDRLNDNQTLVRLLVTAVNAEAMCDFRKL